MAERLPRRVLLTGVGVIHAAVTGGGEAVDAFLAAPGAPSPSGGALDRLVDEREARRLSRACQLAVAATRLALADAGLAAADDVGFVVGTEFGDLRSTVDFADGYLRSGPGGLSALLFPNTVMNAMAAATTIAVGARRFSVTLNAPTVGGELAVAHAVAAVAAGRVDAVVAGGVDELDPRIADTLAAVGAPAQRRGEGAAFVVLEAEDRARARGARVRGEILAAAWRALPARPHGVGRGTASHAVAAALAAARRAPRDVAAVYASASGDRARDLWESRVLDGALASHRPPRAALATVVGAHAGHGALATAAAAWTARGGRLPGGAPAAPGPVLVHALARGGTHVALLVAGTDAA